MGGFYKEVSEVLMCCNYNYRISTRKGQLIPGDLKKPYRW